MVVVVVVTGAVVVMTGAVVVVTGAVVVVTGAVVVMTGAVVVVTGAVVVVTGAGFVGAAGFLASRRIMTASICLAWPVVPAVAPLVTQPCQPTLRTWAR